MFQLERQYYEAMVAHARGQYPNESCGLVAGQGGKAVQLYQTTNVDPNPQVRYQIDPKELLETFRELDRLGWGVLGIFQSHPHTQAYPSATDISLSFYSDAIYFIMSLRDFDQPELRAFRIVDGQIDEEAIEIVE